MLHETRLVRGRQKPRPHSVSDHHLVLSLRDPLHNVQTILLGDAQVDKKIETFGSSERQTHIEGDVSMPAIDKANGEAIVTSHHSMNRALS